MRDFLSVSEAELVERRIYLRRQRRWKALQSIWRSLLVMGITGGLVWGVTRPIWVIRSADQVSIQGNSLLETETIQALLPISYPQALVTVQPEVIARELEARAPIATATVQRQLFPPRLSVHVQERYPVAIAYRPAVNPAALPPQRREEMLADQVGLVDEKGFWISVDRYVNLDQMLELPDLKVLGMRDEYQEQWLLLYGAIRSSPVQVQEIDWRDPANLILTTEVGMVHLGPLGDRIDTQLRALDQLRDLPEALDDISQLDYIDLRNPQSPVLQLFPSGTLPSQIEIPTDNAIPPIEENP
jgi:cell division protein FtsQ